MSFSIGSSLAIGSRVNPAASPPPDPTPGQTPLWRSLTTVAPPTTITTANYDTKTNFDSYSGEDSYARVPGARYGPAENPSWGSNGLRHAIPYLGDAGNPANVVFAKKDMGVAAAYRDCGMHCAWLNFMTVGNGNRVLMNRDYATNGPVLGLGVLAGTGSKLTFYRRDGFNTTQYTTDVELNQWVFLCYAWKWDSPNTKWRAWYKTIGGSMTEFGSEVSINFDARGYCDPCLQCARNGVGHDDDSGLGPWSGSVSAQSAYSLDALATAATYPADIVEPDDGPFTWEVSASAAGGGDGRTSGTAWTYDELQTEIRRATVLGNYKVQTTDGVAVPRPTTYEEAEAARVDCLAGNLTPAGHTIKLTGDFQIDRSLGLHFIHGVNLSGTATLSSIVTLAGPYAQPDSGGHPNVWLKSGLYRKAASGFTDTGPVLVADGYQFTPVAGANLAAVIGDLDDPYTCYVDGDGMYFHSAADPNTDGLVRTCGTVLTQGLASYLAMVDLEGGRIGPGITIETGLIYRYEAGATLPQYGVSVTNGPKTLASVACTIVGGSYHALGFIGSLNDTFTTGTLILDNDLTFRKFCPGPANDGTTIAVYDPDDTNTGTIFHMYGPGCVEESSIFCGEQVSTAVRAFGSIYSHGGGGSNALFGAHVFGSWKGTIGLGRARTGEDVIDESTTYYEP